ncbi:hypothetical protein M3B46_03955 [Sphingobacterium daejeonense]|uniref:hypothetical protein n=2 Tax=Sphingobacterium daejeonense TaxID=371142 RepID=UPI0021A26BAF|nr:hypothetical protein [Sphingobacterium daejeonense]MCT1530131.1 hypothetical protein [Sphingobacterium daejeonense]
MKKRHLLTVFSLLFLSVLSYSFKIFEKDKDGIVMKNRRELFIDDYLLEKLENLNQRLVLPRATGEIIKFDKPWEGKFVTYVSIIKDPTGYKMYYRGMADYNGKKDEVACLATSKDGLKWEKPNLKLYKVNGTLNNNVVIPPNEQLSMHNFTVFYDQKATNPNEKYKAIGGANHSNKTRDGLYRYVSSDGIKWNLYSKDTSALFSDYALDSQNVLLWSESEQCYAIYLRAWTGNKPGLPYPKDGIRTIARSTSKDFVNWTNPVEMTFDDTELEHLYTNASVSYFRAPQIIVSMPFRFMVNQKILSDEQLTEFGTDKSQWKGMSDGVFMTTRGGNNFNRKFNKSFIRPGFDKKNWSARNNIPAKGIIQTSENEMSLYVTRNYGSPTVNLERLSLRIDGFSNLEADYEEGFAITKPVIIKSKNMFANFETATSGYLIVEVLDLDGNPIPEYSGTNSLKILGDEIDKKITWNNHSDLSNLIDKKVRFKFRLKDANLYSFALMD